MHPRCWRYAKGFVDKDEPDVALEPHVETAVDENETEIAPEPYEFQTAEVLPTYGPIESKSHLWVSKPC